MPVVTLDEAFPNHGAAWLDGLEKEFRHGWELEKVQYMERQLAAQQAEGGPKRTVDGLGQHIATIDARTYFRWLQEDEHFWEDRGNVVKFIKDNPECRVQAPEKKARIVV